MTTTFTEQAKVLFEEILKNNLTEDVWNWLSMIANDSKATASTFTRIPRKTGKASIKLTAEQRQLIPVIEEWKIDKLARIWLLMNIAHEDKLTYTRHVEILFEGAEVNELVALYTALPYLPYPEHWTAKCADGIRSNIGDVLQAIMCNNAYPADHLNESAWNQLVLKAIFTEKPVHLITGLDKRANITLAKALSYFAHERWAASRTFSPQLWRCVGKFIDEQIFKDIEKISTSADPLEREAAALACNDSSYPPAKELLERLPEMKRAIDAGHLTWNILAEKALAN